MSCGYLLVRVSSSGLRVSPSGLRVSPKLQALVYDILWRKVPESDARSVGDILWRKVPESDARSVGIS